MVAKHDVPNSMTEKQGWSLVSSKESRIEFGLSPPYTHQNDALNVGNAGGKPT
jgi:hypothetical protein